MSETTYSPRLRTGILLCGAGTAGAYHAGVLRALVEAGVKIDVVAAHGAGMTTALAVAIDGGAKVWDPAGPWTDQRMRQSYRWRAALRWAAYGLLAAMGLLLAPLVVLVLAALAYGLGTLAALVNLETLASELIAAHSRAVAFLFDPPVLPTVVPRAIVLAVLVVAVILCAAAVQAARHERSRRRFQGAFWWRLLGSPLEAQQPAGTLIDTLWQLVRGASKEPRPKSTEVGRRYVDVLADNFGQPGFREVLLAAHDIDARRDLVGAVLPAQARAGFEARRATGGVREAETLDFTGPLRDHVIDFVVAGLRLPVATEPHPLQFPAESFWRGERHRLCDRPELAVRLIDELAAIGVEQVILVSAAPPAATPHGMRTRPGTMRARVGEVLRAVETAALQDAWTAASGRFYAGFVIRPDHNPIGPFDFGGAYDESSDRQRTIGELIQLGYDDAYRQFIETVAATA